MKNKLMMAALACSDVRACHDAAPSSRPTPIVYNNGHHYHHYRRHCGGGRNGAVGTVAGGVGWRSDRRGRARQREPTAP